MEFDPVSQLPEYPTACTKPGHARLDGRGCLAMKGFAGVIAYLSQVATIAAGWALGGGLPPTREVRFQFANLGFVCVVLFGIEVVISLRKAASSLDNSCSLTSIAIRRRPEIGISMLMAIYVLFVMILDPFMRWFDYLDLFQVGWMVPISIAVFYFLRKRNWFAVAGALGFLGVVTAVIKYNVRWIDHGVGFFSWWTT